MKKSKSITSTSTLTSKPKPKPKPKPETKSIPIVSSLPKNNNTKIINYENGDTYEGNIKNGMKNGVGKMIYTGLS